MDYSRIYNELISNAKDRDLTCYAEKHHIIPRCLNGNDSPDNLVNLTAREHFIAHKLLTFIYPRNLNIIHAFGMLMHIRRPGNGYRDGFRISSRDYQYLRELCANTPLPPERIAKLVASHKGKPSPQRGLKHTPEQVEKNRIAQTGKKQSEKTKEKRRQGMMGKNNKPILQFDKDGNFIKEWHSTNEASRQLGIGDSGIWKAMNGRRKYFGGFIWKYKK